MSVDAARTNGFDLDALFDVLCNKRRRVVLRVLVDNDRPLQRSELIDHVVLRVFSGRVESNQRESVRVTLAQKHIPKLLEFGAIEIDRGGIRLGEQAGRCLKHLDVAEQEAGR